MNIFTLNALISTNKISMFKLAVEVCFENHCGLIHAIFLSVGSTKSVYLFLGHPVVTFLFNEKHAVVFEPFLALLSILCCHQHNYIFHFCLEIERYD